MPRRLRIEYPGAHYHVMARGNARQKIVRDDRDRERFLDCLGQTVGRYDWHLFAFVLMSNHLHLVLKTPRPNLGRGMQALLSAHANLLARRHRFVGHVFQGRYRAELMEDESYLWVVSRYVHLNPVRAGLAAHPADWPWSSYPGYARRTRRLEWVAYDELLRAWAGSFGGRDPATAYRRFVTAGMDEPPSSPWTDAHQGWILGSRAFVERIRDLVQTAPTGAQRREGGMLRGLDLRLVQRVVCEYYGIDPRLLSRRGDRHLARPALAYLSRRHTEASLADLAPMLGLSRPESVPNLTRRFAASIQKHSTVRRDLNLLEKALAEARDEEKN